MEIRGKYLIHNLEVIPVDRYNLMQQPDELTLYEVFRIIGRVPLFLEDHLERFANSAQLAGVTLPFSIEQIRQAVCRLIKINRFRNANIKLIACYPFGRNPYFTAYFVEHQYPTAGMFRLGVDTITFKAIRYNPNAKIFNTPLRTETNELKSCRDIYEVLLVDENNNVTEGSRSNFFAIRGNMVFTPPLCEVLPGVTRKHVLEACSILGFDVIEKSITVAELGNFAAVFLTGTSRKILPIRKINNIRFAVDNPVMRNLMAAFAEIVKIYLQQYKCAGQ
jgi:branched-chain amino acid aminotransferase